MKKILIIGLSLGLIVIVALGGYMVYRVDGLKSQAETSINQMLKNQNALLNKTEFSLSFDPFKCDGLIFVECKNKKIEFLKKNGDLLAVFENPVLSVESFDTEGLTFKYFSDFIYLQKSDLEGYFRVLMPKKLEAIVKVSLETNESFFLDTHCELRAENLTYFFEVKQRIVSRELKRYGLLKYIEQTNFDGNVMLRWAELELQSKNLSQALFDVLRKQYGGNLDFSSYRGLVTLMANLSMEQVSHFGSLQELLSGIKELVLGEKQKLIAVFKPSNEICLTCDQIKIENFVNNDGIKIETLQ